MVPVMRPEFPEFPETGASPTPKPRAPFKGAGLAGTAEGCQ
jgi:hypothetical protein